MSTHLESRILSCALLAVLMAAGGANAQQPYDSITCRAGTMTPLAQADKVFVWILDHRGVTQTSDPKDPFNGFTQRCIGVVAAVEGKVSGNGYCRSVDPTTGDWTLVDWASDKPGHGTWSFRYGTGKWKGVTGGGTYEPAGPTTRPVEPGTYQNCNHAKGTWKLPG